MKTSYFFVKGFLFFFVVGLLVFNSCKEEGMPADLKPVIRRVALTAAPDTAITAADMGAWLAVYGEHLKRVEYIKFNDVEVDMREVYVVDTAFYLQVPLDLPNEITNKISVRTPAGEADHDFKVNFPALSVNAIHNEYTASGEMMKIYGDYFDLYQVGPKTTVVSFGGKEVAVASATNKMLQVKIPEGLDFDTPVEVVNHKFNVRALSSAHYKDRRNMITNFDSDYPYTGSDGQAWVGLWDDPKPLSGNFIKFEANRSSYPSGLGWLYLLQMPFSYNQEMIMHPENYCLKFEIYMKKPLIATQFFIYYYWNQSSAPSPLGGESIRVKNLNEWETLAIPLEKIIPKGLSGTEKVNSLNIRIQCFEPTDDLAMYFDNFRIYKKN